MKQIKKQWLPLYSVQDVHGKDWDIYEEQQTTITLAFKVLKGFPRGQNPLNSSAKRARIILTKDIAEYLEQYPALDASNHLGISLCTIQKFRSTLNLNKKYIKKDPKWLLQHQIELRSAPFQVLETKYGISHFQIATLIEWLNELTYPAKNTVVRMTLDEYKKQHDLSDIVVDPLFQKQNTPQKKINWLIEHRELIFSTRMTVDDIAEQLNKTPQQILKARENLRSYSNTLSVKNSRSAWLLEHQDILLSKLSIDEIAKQLNIAAKSIAHYRVILRKMLNLSKKNKGAYSRGLSEQDRELLLSDEISLKELANQWGYSEKYVGNLKKWLKNPQKFSIKQQRDDWIIEHQKEIEYLSAQMLSEKYNIAIQTAYSYKKRLSQLLLDDKQSLQDYWLNGH